MKSPNPLKPGSKIAVTAFSSGVPKSLHERLDIVIGHLRSSGFEVLEGLCLRDDHKHVSAPAERRAQ
ncbi:hypothetical protein [Photobacterium sanctipauli]|uniref:hypothetical protein n=1 Tax=Photobacterium sanctipauli TaxID=1342794 RepID=UPI001FEAA582|nr:hypothetical protein [Photobacterium sanctipauli]